MKLTPADVQVMQDYIDDLCQRCNVTRTLVWDHGDIDLSLSERGSREYEAKHATIEE